MSDILFLKRKTGTGPDIGTEKTADGLNCNGVKAAVRDYVDLDTAKYALEYTDIRTVVINAPEDCQLLCSLFDEFPRKRFIINNHASLGFLQTTPDGMGLLMAYLDMGKRKNVLVGAVSEDVCRVVGDISDQRLVFCPYIYQIHPQPERTMWKYGDTLHVGCIGDVYPLKNQFAASAAALLIGKYLGATVCFHFGHTTEEGMSNSIYHLYSRSDGVQISRMPKMTWKETLAYIKSLHLLIQPSWDESFLLSAADGIQMNVPSVVGRAVRWAPGWWRVFPWNISSMAEVGEDLIRNPSSVKQGMSALGEHNALAIKAWKALL